MLEHHTRRHGRFGAGIESGQGKRQAIPDLDTERQAAADARDQLGRTRSAFRLPDTDIDPLGIGSARLGYRSSRFTQRPTPVDALVSTRLHERHRMVWLLAHVHRHDRRPDHDTRHRLRACQHASDTRPLHPLLASARPRCLTALHLRVSARAESARLDLVTVRQRPACRQALCSVFGDRPSRRILLTS